MLLLLRRNKILFSSRKAGILGFLFCVAVSFNALGQEERIRAISDSPTIYERTDDRADSYPSSVEKNNGETEQKVPLQKKENKEHIYKQKGEKDVKNEGLSTLSFNLFLYVVDRFKEDN